MIEPGIIAAALFFVLVTLRLLRPMGRNSSVFLCQAGCMAVVVMTHFETAGFYWVCGVIGSIGHMHLFWRDQWLTVARDIIYRPPPR